MSDYQPWRSSVPSNPISGRSPQTVRGRDPSPTYSSDPEESGLLESESGSAILQRPGVQGTALDHNSRPTAEFEVAVVEGGADPADGFAFEYLDLDAEFEFWLPDGEWDIRFYYPAGNDEQFETVVVDHDVTDVGEIQFEMILF